MRRKKPIIGLCGGIGAGKSRVATEFERLGCVVVDSDRLNERVLRRADVLATLREWWGDEVIAPPDTLDRARVAEIVFADPAQRQRLEGLVHPLIIEQGEAIMQVAEEDRAVKAIILDSPLLFESKLDRMCDSIVFVEASRPQRLHRLEQQRRWSEEQLRQREQWQLSPDDKRARSQFAVNNDGPPRATATTG